MNQIIEHAYHRGVSDIHIEPYLDEDVHVRFRIDGVCQEYTTVPNRYSKAMILSCQARDPETAALIAQTWAKSFKNLLDDLAHTGVDETIETVESMYDGTKTELVKAEDELESFRIAWNLGLISLEKDAREH